jgi:hypothetical protein
VRRQDDDPRSRVPATDLVRGVDALQLEERRHLDVGDDHVGLHLVGPGHELGGVGGEAHDLDAVRGVEQGPDTLTHEDVVLPQHHPDAHPALPPIASARPDPTCTIRPWPSASSSPKTTTWSARVPRPSSKRYRMWSF